jgi:hypothetical protein
MQTTMATIKIEDSLQIVKQLRILFEKERSKWLANPNHTIYYSRLYQDTPAVFHMLAALEANLISINNGEN